MVADHSDSSRGGFSGYRIPSSHRTSSPGQIRPQKVLAHDKGVLDMVLQVHKVVKGGSATPEPALDVREKV
jgi:hypothetical protein